MLFLIRTSYSYFIYWNQPSLASVCLIVLGKVILLATWNTFDIKVVALDQVIITWVLDLSIGCFIDASGGTCEILLWQVGLKEEIVFVSIVKVLLGRLGLMRSKYIRMEVIFKGV